MLGWERPRISKPRSALRVVFDCRGPGEIRDSVRGQVAVRCGFRWVRRDWVCLVVRFWRFGAGAGRQAGRWRATGGGAIALSLAVGIGFVWYPRLAALAGWFFLGQRRWRGRMLGKVLMQAGFGEIGFVWYFRFAGRAGLVAWWRGAGAGMHGWPAQYIFVYGHSGAGLAGTVYSYTGIRIQLTAGGWGWRRLADGCCCEGVA